jgi:hypothetical protein
MSAPTVITITDGVVKFADDEAGLTTGEAFECQVTEASINATPNLQTVPATWCAPESQAPAATGFELAITWLQDWTAPDGGLSMWAFTNDTNTKWFSMQLDKDDASTVATGQVRVVAGSYGGAAGTPLTATATWPLAAKPTITVPTGTPSGPATGATAGTPGTWTPSGSTPPADAAAATSDGVVASPTTAWTTGQYVQGSTAGAGGEMHWDGAAWVAGMAP